MKVLTAQALLKEVEMELTKAVGTYPAINNVHEGYAIIREELDEFWDVCKLKPNQRSRAALQNELIQVAAMAIRTAGDCL